MQSISTLIEFLMNLLRDDNAKADFGRDPHAALAAHGLHNVSGQDVRDARLIMADDDAVHPRPGGRSHHYARSEARSEHDDPVREIHHTTAQYEASEHGGYHHNTVSDVNQTFTFVNVDDRDTVVVDSFNSDNHGIDNKGGNISESVLSGHDINGQVGVDNRDDVHVTAINKSFNEDNRSNTDVVKVQDSFNRTTESQPAPGSPTPDPSTPNPDALHSDALHSDAPDASAPNPDAPHPDAPEASTSNPDVPDASASDPNAPHPDAPHADAPEASAPDASTSNPEAPHASAPDTEPPHGDAPDPAVLVDHPLVDHPLVDVPVDHSLVDHSPVDEPPVDEPPVDHPAEEHAVHDLAPDVPDDEPELDHAFV